MLTEDQLGRIVNRMSYKPKQGDVVDALNTGMDEAEINTPLRIAMYLAQILTETGGFKYFVEQGNVGYFQKYEGRADLGNLVRGDGYKYRGRGFIQITGRSNYGQAGASLKLDLIGNPDMAKDLGPAARIAGWFWRTNGLNGPSDAGNIRKVTRRINGGYTGLEDRIAWYEKAKDAFGI